MSFFLCVYLIGALISAVLEARTFEVDNDPDESKTATYIGASLLVIHLARVAINWPLYLVEDILLGLWNKHLEKQEEA